MVRSMTKVMLCCVWVVALTTCCLGWPSGSSHRKSYNSYDSDYALPLMMGEGAYEANQWELAQDPEYEDTLQDYYEHKQPLQYLPINPQIEALANLLYDTKKDDDVWGEIVRERPETELEELKELSGYGPDMDKRAGQRATSTASPPVKATTVGPVALKSGPKSNMAPTHLGQKEFPLLRPPVQPKAKEAVSPVIAQRSLASDKKPSPYDTLRKYLSIEDALKKEAEKRTAFQKGSSRQVKRSFVADADSLTGQLNKLKSPASA